MTELFVSAFVTFLVVIDPPGCAPIFASLTRGATPAHRRAMAFRSVAIAAGILLFFGLLGEDLLRALGISLAAFRIAGGILLFLIALDMVFEKRTERRENRAEEVERRREHRGRLGLPDGDPDDRRPRLDRLDHAADGAQRRPRRDRWSCSARSARPCCSPCSACSLAGPLMRLLGHKMEAMITRLLGVILAALAVQFVIDGTRAQLRV